MARYFFNLIDHQRDPDAEGTECTNLEAARLEAVVFAGSYLRDHPRLVWDGQRFGVEVTDEAGQRVFSVWIEASPA